ncbi:MAG: VTT domain-containing protein [Oscillospiraceae bacterium]|nr:VTT domain-containing protein [Oscillospiraceae bacterium]
MKTRRWIITLAVVAALLAVSAALLYRNGFFDIITSVETLQAYIENYAPYSHLIFFAIQLLSVILAPIPNNVIALAGAALFGVWPSFFLTFGAVLLGSMIVFSLARVIGQPFAQRFVNAKVSKRYLALLHNKQGTFLFLVFLFPFFPDDLICILAGLTDIKPLHFFLIALIARPWGLLVACLFGGSALSLPVWAMVVLGICGVALFVVCMKYADRLERKLLGWIRRKT